MNVLIRLGCFALLMVGVGAFGNQGNIENTTWRGISGESGEMEIRFDSSGKGQYLKHNGAGVETYSDISWKQDGAVITAEINKGFAVLRGEIHNNILAGVAKNKNGKSWNFLYKLVSHTSPVFSPKNPYVGNQSEVYRNQLNSDLAIFQFELSEEKRKQVVIKNQPREAEKQQPPTPQPPSTNIPAFIGKRIALVVGNANYRVRPLMNSRNDADDVSRALKGSGFEVIDVRDGSLSQMRTAVRQFGDKLLTNDVGLVYYSGHGIEVKGRNYFIPVNADIQREDEIADQGLDVALILEKMNTAQRSVNIMIVDACRDDPFGRSFRSSSRGLATMEAPRGTIIAYATSPGKVASDGDPRERNSPYTKHLLRAMQAPNKPIEQVFKEVRPAVHDETKNQQTPWENTSLSGDFYFKVVR